MGTAAIGRVVALYICAAPGEPMETRDQVYAMAGRGLAGDRYALDRGTFSRAARKAIRHVTLIEREAIAAASCMLAGQGMAPFAARETRRNIVTDGQDVCALLGLEFSIGSVVMRGIEPTRPCHIPSIGANKTGFSEAFAGRGGIRAEILSNGVITVGSPISVFNFNSRPNGKVENV